MTERITRREVGKALWQQMPLLVGLVLLWMAVWGEVSWLSLFSGIVVAIVVTQAFYLPAVELSGRFHVFWAFVFVLRFFGELFVASFQVAFLALRRTPPQRNSIVAVDLVTRSDFVMTVTGITVSLIPGSVIVDIDRGESILYLHVLGADDAESVEHMRRRVLAFEQRVVRAIGSRDDVRRSNV